MSWKVIWLSLKSRDMVKRLAAVLGMLLVFRLLAHIPVPLSDAATLRQILDNIFQARSSSQLLSFIDVLSGGALANFSIVLVGLGPYINASIIMQLLTKAIPQLEALNKEGEYGRRKINQYTRLLTLPLAIVQSVGAIFLVRQTALQIGGLGDITARAGGGQWVLMVAALTGGAMLLMWLGELMTEQGIGNGISLLITAGIVSRLPSTTISLVRNLGSRTGNMQLLGFNVPISGRSLAEAAIILLSVLLVTIFIVKLNEASRQITVHYAKRVQGNRAYGGVTTMLPIKLITAGVVPIIFALAFLSVPSFVGQLLAGAKAGAWQQIGATLRLWFQPPSTASLAQPGVTPYIYPLVYFLLVFVFTFFYTNVSFNAKEIAENLHKEGGFIESVRSGRATERYLSRTVNRLTLFGALSLGLLALLPMMAQIFLKTNIAIGGTSILILVAVALETLRSIESRALMVTYDQFSGRDFEPANSVKARPRLAGLLRRR